MTELARMTIEEFVAALSAKTPTPGGGSAAAAVSALGAGLGTMVARYSKGTGPEEAVKALEPLSASLTALIDEDARAYGTVSEAMKLPKKTDEEKSARQAAMKAAFMKAIEVPLRTIDVSFKALRAIAAFAPESNKNLVSDLSGAVVFLASGIEVAAHNVYLNLQSLGASAAQEELRARTSQIVGEAEKLREQLLAGLKVIGS